MMAAPNPVVAAYAPVLAALGALPTQAQVTAQLAAAVAPLATQAQVAAATLATQAQVAAATAPLATQAQVAALAAQVAALTALLAPLNVPTIVGGASAIVRSLASARARNAHDRGDDYAIVVLDNGQAPANWPQHFRRLELVEGPIGPVDALLNDYGLPFGAGAGTPFDRRNALAGYIGTMRAS